jgi:ABC-type nitrate/sulfonate/bicarbonate transport system substrate-binding protein
VRPEIETLADLRGKVVSVDAPTSGFAYVAYELLARAGLQRGEDYEITPTGGVYDRYQALIAGAPFEGTLLSGGFETRAARAGFRLLEDVLSIADPYLGVWATARDEWLAEHEDAAIGFVRGYLAGSDWVFDPDNRDACIELLQRQPGTDRELAEELLEVQLRPGVGNVPDGHIDPEAVHNVLELRRRFGGFEAELDLDALAQPGGGLYDDRLLRAAVAAR